MRGGRVPPFTTEIESDHCVTLSKKTFQTHDQYLPILENLLTSSGLTVLGDEENGLVPTNNRRKTL